MAAIVTQLYLAKQDQVARLMNLTRKVFLLDSEVDLWTVLSLFYPTIKVILKNLKQACQQYLSCTKCIRKNFDNGCSLETEYALDFVNFDMAAYT